MSVKDDDDILISRTLIKKKTKFLILYKEIQMESGATSNMRKCTNILTIYEEVVSHI
jgi:hypothetical protein